MKNRKQKIEIKNKKIKNKKIMKNYKNNEKQKK